MTPRSRVSMYGLVACLLLSCATAVWGRIVMTPPWVANPNDPKWAGGSTTFVQWEFAHDPTAPIRWDTNYTTSLVPNISFPAGSTYPDVVPGPDGQPIPTWHIGDNGDITIFCPNDPRDRPYKEILLQITSDKGQPAIPKANGTPASVAGIFGFPGSNWYTYAYSWHLEPNPPYELITIPAVPSTNVEEIVINTICVPEPASVMCLGLAAPLLLARKRRARA